MENVTVFNDTDGNCDVAFTNASDSLFTEMGHIERIILLIGFIVDVPGFALNILFIIVSIYGFRKNAISQKLYIFLLNKAVADVLRCAGRIATRLTIESNSLIVYIFILVVQSVGIWTSAVTFLALSLLALFAQKRPFLHRRLRTARFCIRIAIVSWPIAFILALSGMIPNILAFADEITWSTEANHPLKYIHISLYVIMLIAIIVINFVVRISAKKLVNKNKNRSKSAAADAARLIFALIAVYLVTDSAAVCYAILTLIIDIKTYNAFDACDIDTMRAWKSVQYAAWMLAVFGSFRYIIDPIITFIVDRRFRKCLREMLGLSFVKCTK